MHAYRPAFNAQSMVVQCILEEIKLLLMTDIHIHINIHMPTLGCLGEVIDFQESYKFLGVSGGSYGSILFAVVSGDDEQLVPRLQ